MILASPDGQWAAVRRGREVTLLAGGAAPAVGKLELPSADTDLALVGSPAVLVAVTRGERPGVVLHQPPSLEAVARLDLDMPMRLAAITGPRLALVSQDAKHVTVLRVAPRALASAVIDPGGPVDFVVGLERNQLLFGLSRKLEVWDAVSARPLLRLSLQLPPPPRTVGAALGHLWATRPGSDEVFVYRLSDGRPFRHHVGAPVDEVICHPASSVLVFVTKRGLVRLHCLAHSLAVLDAPAGTAFAQLVAGDDLALLGIGDEGLEPWRIALGGTPVEPAREPEPSEPVRRAPAIGAATTELVPTIRVEPTARPRTWREPLATAGAELARGADVELPVVAVESELGALAHRLALSSHARRALGALYALYLVGDPNISIARLAHVLGEWSEPLGQGELGALAMLRRRGGRIALRPAVTDLLDGLAPRAIRFVGNTATVPRIGAVRVARAGKPDAAIEAELATQLGRIAVIEGGPSSGLLEARLHDTTAVTLAPPATRPLPWPRDAGLVVVCGDAAPSWAGGLPAL